MPDQIYSEESPLRTDYVQEHTSSDDEDSFDTQRHGSSSSSIDDSVRAQLEEQIDTLSESVSSSCISATNKDEQNKEINKDGSNKDNKTLSSHLRNEMATLQHLDPRHLHIRDQADMLSRIPGLNLFIRPYEELTTTNIEAMLGAMESRILDRMDLIVEKVDMMERRLTTIEKHLNTNAGGAELQCREASIV